MFPVNSLNMTQHCSIQNIIKERCYTIVTDSEALGPSSTTTGHLHDDIILLRPESFRVLLPCANLGFRYSNLTGITKFKQKGLWWRHRANGLLPLLVVKFLRVFVTELHIKLSRILPAPRVFISALQIQEKSFLLLLYILSLTFPRKRRKTLCYMALIKREILTSREVLYAALHAYNQSWSFYKKDAFQKNRFFCFFFFT